MAQMQRSALNILGMSAKELFDYIHTYKKEIPWPDATEIEMEISFTEEGEMNLRWVGNHTPARANVRPSDRLLITAIEGREHTMMQVMGCIAEHQKAYLLLGEPLQVLTMEDIGADLGKHVSTISRSVRGKRIRTPQGELDMRALFSSALHEDISTDQAKSVLLEILNDEVEETSFTDSQIANMMHMRGIELVPRTVTKYRAEMGIPTRKERWRKRIQSFTKNQATSRNGC